MLWISTAVSALIFAINMGTAPMFGVSPGYAFGYSLPHLLFGVLMAVIAVPITRGRPWARTMAKAVLIGQIVLQTLMLISGTAFLWALVLLPLAITGLVNLSQPPAKWFFAAHDPRQAQRMPYPQQYPQHPHHPQQGYGQQPPGSWGQGPHHG